MVKAKIFTCMHAISPWRYRGSLKEWGQGVNHLITEWVTPLKCALLAMYRLVDLDLEDYN